MRAFACVVIVAAAATSGCASDHSASSLTADLPGEPVALDPIPLSPPPCPPSMNDSGYAEPALLVIRAPSEWASTWAKIFENSLEPPPLPSIDFGAKMVVVASSGRHSSGGFDVALPNAAVEDGMMRVRVVESSPGPRCGVTGMITSPVAASIVTRHEGTVEFVMDSVVNWCD